MILNLSIENGCSKHTKKGPYSLVPAGQALWVILLKLWHLQELRCFQVWEQDPVLQSVFTNVYRGTL